MAACFRPITGATFSAATDVFDFIVRGEGEATIVALIEALERRQPLSDLAGIAFRDDLRRPFATPPARTIATLDDYRVGWELIDHSRYSYWGGKRAVVMQFSRGCPHLCNYCGQRGFWTRWRHRDPEKFAQEIAWLHREHGVELINLADENPTSSKKAWRAFLDAMIAENVPVLIVGSTRADDIVRDADILHLYRKAGVIRWLLGMENTDEQTLQLISKGGSTAYDREAIRLLRQHGILSMATWVAGFEDEGLRDLWRGFRQLIAYDPDQIQALYVTPHRWTPFFRIARDRKVIQTDARLWDYKHQVLPMRRLKPWMLFFSVKLIEVAVQSRPKAMARILFHPDPEQRHSMRWYTQMGRRVWFREVWDFLFRDRRMKDGPDARRILGRAAGRGRGIDGGHAPGPQAGRARDRDVAERLRRYRLAAAHGTISVPAPCSVNSSSSTACGVLPLRMTTPSTPRSIASMQVSTLGIMPPEIVPSLISALASATVSSLISLPVLVEHAGHVGEEQQARGVAARRQWRRQRCRH